MEQRMYHSPDDVAKLLGLHVRSVRRFIREGKLNATRIGRQYRITDEELKKFLGWDRQDKGAHIRPPGQNVVVSTTVDINAVDRTEQERLMNLLLGAFSSLRDGQQGRRFDSVYYEGEMRLRISINADLDLTNAVLGMLRGVLDAGDR